MPHARTSAEPDDGLSTRQRRLRPVLVVNTGEGKGKTTAAMGTALRAWHQGWRVGVFQFVKSGRWHVGEEDALRALGQLHEEIGVGGPVTWEVMGTGWSWTRSFDAAENPEAAAREGWRHVSDLLAHEALDFYLLDEFTYPMDWGWLGVDEVVETLVNRPGTQHVVITGRRAPDALVEVADIVTEMTKIKHPFDVGQRGQAGIEWWCAFHEFLLPPRHRVVAKQLLLPVSWQLFAPVAGRWRLSRSDRTTSTPDTTRWRVDVPVATSTP